jgi:hypothetical protein
MMMTQTPSKNESNESALLNETYVHQRTPFKRAANKQKQVEQTPVKRPRNSTEKGFNNQTSAYQMAPIKDQTPMKRPRNSTDKELNTQTSTYQMTPNKNETPIKRPRNSTDKELNSQTSTYQMAPQTPNKNATPFKRPRNSTTEQELTLNYQMTPKALKTYNCHLCNFRSLDQSSMLVHVGIVHSREKMKRFFGEKEFQCGICGDVMDSDDSTIGHIARDHRVLGMKN